jgi:hypothetical protein
MRSIPERSRALILAATALCVGCGGDLRETPTDLSKGPVMTPRKSKSMEEAKAQYDAMRAKSKRNPAGARRPPP